MAFIRRNQQFFNQPAPNWIGESPDTASVPHIINCLTINGTAIVPGALVTTTAVQTLTNKSLVDNSTFIIDNVDATRRMNFDTSAVNAAGLVTMTFTGATHSVTFPDPGVAATSIMQTDGNQVATGTLQLTNATASTSTTTGALTITGGLGLQGQVTAAQMSSEGPVAIASATDLTNAIFAASWSTTVDADMSPVITGAITGAATITASRLDLRTSVAPNYVSYPCAEILEPNASTELTILCRYIPNYASPPALTQYIFSCSNATGSNANLVQLRHTAAGNLELNYYGPTGLGPVTRTAAWAPVAGTEYEIEASFDFDHNQSHLYIDGVRVSTGAAATAHTTPTGNMYIGANAFAPAGADWPDFRIYNLVLFSLTRHSAATYAIVPQYRVLAGTSGGVISATGLTASARIVALGGITNIYPPIAPNDVARLADFSDPTILSTCTPSFASLTVSSSLANARLIASYSRNMYLDTAPSATYTTVGATVITNAHLNVSGGTSIYYDAAANLTGLTVTGTIRMKITPAYNETPGATQYFFSTSQALASSNNLIRIMHTITNNLYLEVYDSAGAAIFAYAYAGWMPGVGTEYDLEFNYNTAPGGIAQTYINGVIVATGVQGAHVGRTNALDVFYIGDNRVAPVGGANFFARDLVIHTTVVHTTDYDTTSFTTVGINTYTVANVSAVVSSGAISSGVAPTAPTNVPRLLDFQTASTETVLLDVTGAARSLAPDTSVSAVMLRVGNLITIRLVSSTTVGSRMETFGGAGGTITLGAIASIPAIYRPTGNIAFYVRGFETGGLGADFLINMVLQIGGTITATANPDPPGFSVGALFPVGWYSDVIFTFVQ